MLLDARIGYRSKYDKPNDWKLLADSLEERILECQIEEKKEGYPYQCELIPLFELGSLHHDFYLINIRLPVTQDGEHNKVMDGWLTYSSAVRMKYLPGVSGYRHASRNAPSDDIPKWRLY